MTKQLTGERCRECSIWEIFFNWSITDSTTARLRNNKRSHRGIKVTHLHRNQPDVPAVEILSPVQIQVLKARFPNSPNVLTIFWAIQSIAHLGGYLEHRRKSPIGIQVLWRGWSNLHVT